MGDDSLPVWMTHGCTVLCQKDLRKGNTVANYHPLTCLLLLRKLLTGVIAEEMHDYVEQEKLARRTKRMQTGNPWNKGSFTY